MEPFRVVLLAAVALYLIAPTVANTTPCLRVVAGDGLIFPTAPVSLEVNAYQDNDHMYAVLERKNHNTTGEHIIDPGKNLLPANTCVNTYMIWLDSINGALVEKFNVQFDLGYEIIATQSDDDGVGELSSRFDLGSPTTIYPFGDDQSKYFLPARGLESSDDQEGVTFSGSIVTVSMRVTHPGDWVRVITKCGDIDVCDGGNPPIGSGQPVPNDGPCLTTGDITQGRFESGITSTMPTAFEAEWMQAFLERKYVTLTEDLPVTGGVISYEEHPTINSFMVFLDSHMEMDATRDTTFNFGSRVLGYMGEKDGSLQFNSAFLNKPGVMYPSSWPNRGLESEDIVQINPNGDDDRVVRFKMRVTSPGDWVRVITEASNVDCSVQRVYTGPGDYSASPSEIPDSCCNGKHICVNFV